MQAGMQGWKTELSGNKILDAQGIDTKLPHPKQQDLGASVGTQLIQWSVDHAYSQLSDYSASFLDIATQQHPSVLTVFTLDSSRMTCIGLASVQCILFRSNLEYLKIICTPFTPDLPGIVGQVLASIQWSTLKSLNLSGDNINEWINLWPAPITSQLLCFMIQGTGSAPQVLAHSSVLWIHQLVCASSLAMIHLTDVQLQDNRDWVLIVESLDPLLLQIFGLCSMTALQFKFCQEAVDLYKLNFLLDWRTRVFE